MQVYCTFYNSVVCIYDCSNVVGLGEDGQTATDNLWLNSMIGSVLLTSGQHLHRLTHFQTHFHRMYHGDVLHHRRDIASLTAPDRRKLLITLYHSSPVTLI